MAKVFPEKPNGFYKVDKAFELKKEYFYIIVKRKLQQLCLFQGSDNKKIKGVGLTPYELMKRDSSFSRYVWNGESEPTGDFVTEFLMDKTKD